MKTFLSFGILIAALGYQICQAEELPKVKIGVIQSLTGIAAEYGLNNVRALEIARDDMKKAGRADVELIVEDDQTDPKQTVNAFNKLLSQKVEAIIGATWDFTTNSILPLAARNKLVVISASSLKQSLALNTSNGYGFALGFTASEEIQPFSIFLNRNDLKKMAIVYANNPWGEAQLQAYSQMARDHGLEVVYQDHPVGYDANDLGGFVPKMKASGADLIGLFLNKSDIEVILRRIREQQLASRFYLSPNTYDAFNSSADKKFMKMCASHIR